MTLSLQIKTSRKSKKVVLMVMIMVLLILFLVRLAIRPSWYQLNSNFSFALSDSQGNTLLVAIPVAESNGLFIYISGEQVLNSARRLGTYPLKNIYKLGEQQKIGGGQLLKESLQKNLLVPVDAYLHGMKNIDLGSNNDTYSAAAAWQVKKALVFSLLPGSNTDLPMIDRLKLQYFLTKNRTSAWDFLDFRLFANSENNQSEPVSLDSLRVGDLDFYAFADQRMIKEDRTIGIYNAGNCPELAAKSKTILKHMGAGTIDIQDLAIADSTLILLKDKNDKKSAYIKRLRRIFRISTVRVYEFPQRADMIFVFGSDYCRVSL